MVFETEPQLFGLVELAGLRGGIRVRERVDVRPRGRRAVAPDRIAAAHQVSAVEVVARVDGGAGLLVLGDPVVEVPVVRAVEVEQQVAVDVHTGRLREPPDGVEQHREVRVRELTNGRARGRCGQGDRKSEEVLSVPCAVGCCGIHRPSQPSGRPGHVGNSDHCPKSSNAVSGGWAEGYRERHARRDAGSSGLLAGRARVPLRPALHGRGVECRGHAR